MSSSVEMQECTVKLHIVALYKGVYFCLQTSDHHSYAFNKRNRIHMSKNPYWNKYCISPNIRWLFLGSLPHRRGGFFYKRDFNESSRNMSLSSKYWLIRHIVWCSFSINIIVNASELRALKLTNDIFSIIIFKFFLEKSLCHLYLEKPYFRPYTVFALLKYVRSCTTYVFLCRLREDVVQRRRQKRKWCAWR